MSKFEDELKALKQREIEKENARQALEQERRKLAAEKERIAREHYSALEGFTKSEVEPFLSRINVSYCDRSGKIYYRGRHETKGETKNKAWGKTSVEKKEVVSVQVVIRWDVWGEWPYGMGNGHYGAKDLGIVVSDESLSVIVGRSVEYPNMGGQIALISRKDINWQNKLEQSLVSALASGSCEWKAYWDNTP